MVDGSENPLGIYISVPFCRSKCTYCNFASGVYPAADHHRYVSRVIDDLAGAAAWAAAAGLALPRQVDSVYLGGGTPSLLAPEFLSRLFAAIRTHFDVDADAEITVECAPGQLADETPQALAAAGVNRVSLGVQSFIDAEAHASGRLHNRAIVATDLSRLRSAGIANLNIDLIAGLAGQTFSSWQESLDVLIGSGVPHASIYMLEVDEDSRLGRELLRGGERYRAALVPNDDAIAQMYESAIDQLHAAGLHQYEISNFSRPGFASHHNLRYWQRRPYLGLGLDASSMLLAAGLVSGRDFSRAETRNRSSRALAPVGSSVLRETTTADLPAYLAGTRAMETEWITAAQQLEEAWFLGLRLNAGVDITAMQREFGRAMVAPALDTVDRLVEDGLLAFDGARVRLTARGRLLSNQVFQEFLQPEIEEATHRA
jgi:oxygen-independent coproporphyrinogen III oxidase